jgi:hypothetical protein
MPRLLVGGLALLCSAVAADVPQRRQPPLLAYLQVGDRRVMFESPDSTVAHFRFVDEALGRARRPMTAPEMQPTSACYTPDPDPVAGPVTLVFEGDEMGDDEDLTEFELIPAGTRPDVERGCRRVPVAARDIVTDRGVRLGLTRAETDRLLGKPARVTAGVTEYERTTSRRATAQDGAIYSYDLFSAITVTFRRGRIVAFSGALGTTD